MSTPARVLAAGLTAFLTYSHYTNGGVLQTKSHHYKKDPDSWQWYPNSEPRDSRYSFRIQMGSLRIQRIQTGK